MKTRYQPLESARPSGLNGISDEQIKDHWELYLGYVKQTNTLLDELETFQKAGQGSSLSCADRRRRLGFEFNGMIMHESYFQAMTSEKEHNSIENARELAEGLIYNFGSIDAWSTDFKSIGKTRGIGWVVMGQNPRNGELLNYFVQEHENGQIAGFSPILVMDVWEHAYMLDYKASGRGEYVEAFVKNINWKIVNDRYKRNE